jgi:hypothetical protein
MSRHPSQISQSLPQIDCYSQYSSSASFDSAGSNYSFDFLLVDSGHSRMETIEQTISEAFAVDRGIPLEIALGIITCTFITLDVPDINHTSSLSVS